MKLINKFQKNKELKNKINLEQNIEKKIQLEHNIQESCDEKDIDFESNKSEKIIYEYNEYMDEQCLSDACISEEDDMLSLKSNKSESNEIYNIICKKCINENKCIFKNEFIILSCKCIFHLDCLIDDFKTSQNIDDYICICKTQLKISEIRYIYEKHQELCLEKINKEDKIIKNLQNKLEYHIGHKNFLNKLIFKTKYIKNLLKFNKYYNKIN